MAGNLAAVIAHHLHAAGQRNHPDIVDAMVRLLHDRAATSVEVRCLIRRAEEMSAEEARSVSLVYGDVLAAAVENLDEALQRAEAAKRESRTFASDEIRRLPLEIRSAYGDQMRTGDVDPEVASKWRQYLTAADRADDFGREPSPVKKLNGANAAAELVQLRAERELYEDRLARAADDENRAKHCRTQLGFLDQQIQRAEFRARQAGIDA